MKTSTRVVTSQDRSKTGPKAGAPIVSRVDPPHPLKDAVPSAADSPATMFDVGDEDLASPSSQSTEDATEQLHTQALQLAGLLKAKQREIDRREALLNARDAKLDNELRLGRLWVREQDAAAAQREQSLVQLETSLAERARQVASTEHALAQDLQSQQATFALQQHTVEESRAELAARESRLAAELAALHVAHERLDAQRAELAATGHVQEQKLASFKADCEERLANQAKNLERASEELQQREQLIAARQQELFGLRDLQEAHTREQAKLAARAAELDQREQTLEREHNVRVSQGFLREQALLELERELADKELHLAAEHDRLQSASAQLARELAELSARSTDVHDKEQRLANKQAESDARKRHIEHEFAVWKDEFRQQLADQIEAAASAQAAIEAQQRELASQQAEFGRLRDCHAWEARLTQAEQSLGETEKLLTAQGRELETQRARLAGERDRLEHAARNQQRELALLLERERAELEVKRQQLEAAAATQEKRRTAVERLAADATQMHREAIEMQLATEQLCAELTGHLTPADLTRALGALRQRLADNFHDAGEKLHCQKAELMELAARLDQQQRKLGDERVQLRDWIAEQQAEIERQAARLVAREQELDAQQEEVAAHRNQVLQQRRELQRLTRQQLSQGAELEMV